MSAARPATHDDIEELVRLRALLFEELRSGWGPPPEGDGWRAACAAAFAEQLGGDRMYAAVVDGGDGHLASCGVIAVDPRLPTPYNPTGLVGHVFGVSTDPRHRRRGHARAVMRELLRWADERGLGRVDLNASEDGLALYRSLGFAQHPDPTLRRDAPSRVPATDGGAAAG